jgi:hypothetical protein
MHSEGKYKFMILKITLMPQIKEAFVWSNINTKSTLQYPFEFCSDISFIGTIFSSNLHLLFVLTLFISDLTFVFLLLSLLVSVQPDISKVFFCIMSENNCLHKNVLLIIKHIWETNWILLDMKQQYVNEISHKRFCRRDKNYMCTVHGSGAWYSETYCIKTLSEDSVFSSDHNNNLKWAILGTQCACLLPRKCF